MFYLYVCDTCGDEDEFEEDYGESMDCGFCQRGTMKKDIPSVL